MWKQAYICVLPVFVLFSLFSDYSDSAPREQGQQVALSIDNGFKLEFSEEALSLIPFEKLKSNKLRSLLFDSRKFLRKTKLSEFSISFDELFEVPPSCFPLD